MEFNATFTRSVDEIVFLICPPIKKYQPLHEMSMVILCTIFHVVVICLVIQL